MRSRSPVKDVAYLDWPEERPGGGGSPSRWFQPGSNLCLDLHGDPAAAPLVVFSDGNHHMALAEALDLFLRQNAGLSGIFYATLPPGPLVNMLKTGGLQMGNLFIGVAPHLFISPPQVLDHLVAEGYMQSHRPFMRTRGSVLLVKKGNPKNIRGVGDLVHKQLRLFLSNPETEAVSHRGYADTLMALAVSEGIAPTLLTDGTGMKTVYGERIHHREAPQALADGRADAAIVYYHLALRYTRIFPARFDIVPLGGTALDPAPGPENTVSKTHAGLVGEGGRWGAKCLRFLSSDAVTRLYGYHGLSRGD